MLGIRRLLNTRCMAATPALPAPVLLSLTPDEGTEDGGDAVTAAGENFVSGAVVVVDGSDVATTFVDDETLTFTSPAHAPGAVDVIVRNPDAQESDPVEFTFEADVPVFDPATLALKFYAGDYDDSTPIWPSLASAGTSGSYAGVQDDGGTFPSEAAIGSIVAANFNGSNDYIGKTGQTLNQLVSAGAGMVAFAFKADTVGPSGQPAYLADVMVGDIAPYFSISYGNAEVQFAFHDGGGWKEVSPVAATVSTWHLAIATWNGTTQRLSIDGGAWSSGSAASIGAAGYEYIFGVNYTSTGYFDGIIAKPMTGAFYCDDTTRDGLWAWAQAQDWWGT